MDKHTAMAFFRIFDCSDQGFNCDDLERSRSIHAAEDDMGRSSPATVINFSQSLKIPFLTTYFYSIRFATFHIKISKLKSLTSELWEYCLSMSKNYFFVFFKTELLLVYKLIRVERFKSKYLKFIQLNGQAF